MLLRKYVFAILIATCIIIITAVLLGGYLRPPSKGLEEIAPSKEPEGIPTEFYPIKLPWLMLKSDERTDMFYASSLPRIPELAFKVNISANIGGILPEALVEGDKIFLADNEGIYALSRYDGSLIWGVDIYFDNLGHRAISEASPKPITKWKALGLWSFVRAYGLGKYLFVGTSFGTPSHLEDAYLLAFDKDSGDLVWKVKLESEGNASSKASVTSNLIVFDGRVFVGSIGREGYVYCVSEEGVFQWRTKVGGNVRGLTYGADALYATSEYSTRLYALDPGTGETLWVFVHNTELNTPIYKKDRIILSDSLGNLLAVSSDGKLLWKKHLGITGDVDTNSYIAADDDNIYAVRSLGERPLNLFKLNFDGDVLGNFTMEDGEYGGRPLVSNGVVILPVVKYYDYNKVYLLWRGLFKLCEFKCEGEVNTWMPKVSAAYCEIYVVANPFTLYKFVDLEKPIITDVKAGLDGDLIINTSVCDKESGLYGVHLVYSFNGADWNYQPMDISIVYVMEPIGGYGFGETPIPYRMRIKMPEDVKTVEFYIVVIDNAGNHEITKVYAYRINK